MMYFPEDAIGWQWCGVLAPEPNLELSTKNDPLYSNFHFSSFVNKNSCQDQLRRDHLRFEPSPEWQAHLDLKMESCLSCHLAPLGSNCYNASLKHRTKGPHCSL